MTLAYPFTEWPILSCIGIFVLLILGLAYGQIVTANLPPDAATSKATTSLTGDDRTFYNSKDAKMTGGK